MIRLGQTTLALGKPTATPVYEAQIVTGAAGSRDKFQASYSSNEYFCEDDGTG
jgi:hypothetical protein